MQFTNLDTLHSYDPYKIIKAILDLIYGTPNATSTAIITHSAFADFLATLPYILINFFAKYVVFSIFFSLAMIILIIVYAAKFRDIKAKVISKILPTEGSEESILGDEKEENPKWTLVLEHINSDDPNKWKLAIIEADIMLAELLEGLNLPGESIGEKLKAVEASDFETIEQAWEAHKIRNAIAHEGSDFLLTEREVKRVVNLYKAVFSEFELI